MPLVTQTNSKIKVVLITYKLKTNCVYILQFFMVLLQCVQVQLLKQPRRFSRSRHQSNALRFKFCAHRVLTTVAGLM